MEKQLCVKDASKLEVYIVKYDYVHDITDEVISNESTDVLAESGKDAAWHVYSRMVHKHNTKNINVYNVYGHWVHSVK